MDGTLQATTSVLELRGSTDTAVVSFIHGTEPGEPVQPRDERELILDREAWVDMGRPEQVTVTIVPGDALNDERGVRADLHQGV